MGTFRVLKPPLLMFAELGAVVVAAVVAAVYAAWPKAVAVEDAVVPLWATPARPMA